MALDRREFRNALGCFATGVAVITARGRDSEPVGMTMSSFNSVSLDPPLILFSLDRRALSLPAMLDAEGYAVNVLRREQEHLSDRFGRPLTGKWNSVEHMLGHADSPLLPGALAHFECAPYAHQDGGEHVIFLGRVVQFSSATGMPLIFFRGRYHGLDARE